MADSAANRISWQQYDLRVDRIPAYAGQGPGGYGNSNDLESDPRLIVFWKFEASALLEDSIGNNDFVKVAGGTGDAVADPVNYISGLAAFDTTLPAQYVTYRVSPLDNNFPGSVNSTEKSYTFAFWIKLEYSPYYDDGGSFRQDTFASNAFRLQWDDYDYENQSCYVDWRVTGLPTGGWHGQPINFTPTVGDRWDYGVWYHVGFTLSANEALTETTWAARIYKSSTQGVLTLGGTLSGVIASVGTVLNLALTSWTGCTSVTRLDEFVIFEGVLTPTELAAIQAGTYEYSP